MMASIDNIIQGYRYITEDVANPNTKDWFLVGHPIQFACILICYVFFATRLGPWYMKDKQPYSLKNVIKIYNMLQVLANLYLFYNGVIYLCSSQFDFRCQNIDDPETPRAKWITRMTWYYFMTKVIDLLDTVFFVLRKSNRQITSLHLHHHTLMPLATWIAVTYFPGGQAVVLATLNCFVHAIMYAYYYIAGLGEEYKKYLWWKKHVTKIQLAQFIIVGVHSFITLFYECGYPMWIKLLLIAYSCLFINLFGQFYYYNYIVKNSKNIYNNAKDKAVNGNHKNGNIKNKMHMNANEAEFEIINNKHKIGKNINVGRSLERNHEKTL